MSASTFKKDVILDRDEGVFYLKSEDAIAWALDQDDFRLCGNTITVDVVEEVDAMVERMKEDGLTIA